MSKWDIAIAFVLEQEGGLTDDPNDPGGLTNFGISKKAYPSLDIKNLTADQAKDIYQRDYWNVCRCDNLPTSFAIALFDMAVNQGTETAIKTLQETFGMTADGIMGPMTVSAVAQAANDSRKIKLFLARRLTQYTRVISANPKLIVFSRNWTFRVLSLAELIFKNP